MPGWTQDEISLPFDGKAEDAAIQFALSNPNQIVDLGLIPEDFYVPQHRKLWSAIIGILLECRTSSPGALYLALIDQIANPKSLIGSIDLLVDWTTDAWDPDAPERGVDYWIDRIKNCVVARRLIDAAQQIAEHAFRVPKENFDVTDASAVLSRVAGVPFREELGIELPI